MSEQDNLRNATRAHIERYGSQKSWFSKKLGCSLSHFTLWLKQEREFSDEKLSKLKTILSA